MGEVVIVIGVGSIGQAIPRRVSAGKQVVLADLHEQNAHAAADVMRDAGFDVSTSTVDVSSRQSVHALVERATGLGDVTGLIHAAGVSPSQASPAMILEVDLLKPHRRTCPHNQRLGASESGTATVSGRRTPSGDPRERLHGPGWRCMDLTTVLHHLEAAFQDRAEFVRAVPGHRKSRTPFWTIWRKRRHDDRSTGGDSAKQNVPIPIDLRTGKEVKRCPVVPEVIVACRLPGQ